MGFVMDAMPNSRRLKLLTIVDDFSKDSVGIHVEHSITGHDALKVLERTNQFRGNPAAIRTEQGPEFTSRALVQWAYQSAFIESLNGRLQDECPNGSRFLDLQQVKEIIGDWLQGYNK